MIFKKSVIISTILVSQMALSSSAFAHYLSIKATTPIPAQVKTNTTTTGIYIITNITSKVPLTAVEQSQFPNTLTVNQSQSTCGQMLSPGASCVIAVDLKAPSQAEVISGELRIWAKPSLDGVTFPINTQVVSDPLPPPPPPPKLNAICTAVGEYYSATPLLAVGKENCSSWTTKTATDLKEFGILNATSCSTGGLSSICTAVGLSYVGNDAIPAIAVSKDGGNTWTANAIEQSLPFGSFGGVSCTGSNPSSVVCVAGGTGGSTSTQYEPQLVVSRDGGISWHLKTLVNMPTDGRFSSVSCLGNGPSALCVAAGSEDTNNGRQPLLAVSNDGGDTWVRKQDSSLPTDTTLGAVSCTGSTDHAICTAVGENIDGTIPRLFVSKDSGNTWTSKAVANISTGFYNAISCTGEGATAICTAVGEEDTSFNSQAFIAVSTDGGDTWKGKASDLLAKTSLEGTSCTGSGATAVCMAAGSKHVGDAPLVLVSVNGGSSWSAQNIAGVSKGQLSAASCTSQKDTAAMCMASGKDNVDNLPLVVVSVDGGLTWNSKAVANIAGNGTFASATSTS